MRRRRTDKKKNYSLFFRNKTYLVSFYVIDIYLSQSSKLKSQNHNLKPYNLFELNNYTIHINHTFCHPVGIPYTVYLYNNNIPTW